MVTVYRMFRRLQVFPYENLKSKSSSTLSDIRIWMRMHRIPQKRRLWLFQAAHLTADCQQTWVCRGCCLQVLSMRSSAFEQRHIFLHHIAIILFCGNCACVGLLDSFINFAMTSCMQLQFYWHRFIIGCVTRTCQTQKRIQVYASVVNGALW